MGFTYNEQLTNPVSRVRHMLGDTKAPGYRSDETISALLAEYPENETTMLLAESLASEFAMRPSQVSSPDGSLTWGERVKQLQELANRLRLEVDISVVAAATDKLRSFAPVRDLGDIQPTEYNRPLFPIFFNRDGEYWWS